MTRSEHDGAPKDSADTKGVTGNPQLHLAQIVLVEASITSSLGSPAPLPEPAGSAGNTPAAGEARDRFLQVGNRQIQLRSLNSNIDAAYDRLYEQALIRGIIQWGDFNLAVVDFLRITPSSTAMDNFFESATPMGTLLAEEERLERADGYWSRIVSAVTDAEKKLCIKVHKGSGYYFWACNAFHRGDVDSGLLLMHEALAEDARTHNTHAPAWPNTSAAKVVSLDSELMSTHPASWWVNDQVMAINLALEKFGTTLRARDIRKRLFLATDAAKIFLFVHAHASLLRIERMPREHRDNEFVGRLALGHLFHLAVVLEEVIAARSGRSGLFMVQAGELSQRLRGKLKTPVPGGGGPSYASDINAQQRADPDAMLRRLLESTALYGGVPVEGVDRAICIAYVLRNLGGHESAGPRIIVEKLDDFRIQMLGAIARCVEAYYP